MFENMLVEAGEKQQMKMLLTDMHNAADSIRCISDALDTNFDLECKLHVLVIVFLLHLHALNFVLEGNN